MSENILRVSSFNPKVKTYWLVSFVFVLSITVIGIPLLIIAIPLFFWLADKMLKAMSATLTERKLIVKKGVWFKVEKSIPLEKITDVAMSQGPIMSYFGLQQLSFETAGQSGAGALVSLIGIIDAAEFREAILTQKDNITLPTLAPHAEENASELQNLTASVQRIEKLVEKLVEQSSSK